MASEQDSIEVPTPWGGPLKATGGLVILLLLFAALGGIVLWQHSVLRDLAIQHNMQLRELINATNGARAKEHSQQQMDFKEIGCLIQLDIWLHTSGEGDAIRDKSGGVNFARMPYSLYGCVPEFMVPKR